MSLRAIATVLPGLVALLVGCVQGLGQTSIDPQNRFSYGGNLGWMDWRADTANGAVIGEFVCAGYVYSAQAGWIHLGNGSPTNGVRYGNRSPNDFGVNHDGGGNLSGFAWSANIGWLQFTNRDAAGGAVEGPKVDLRTGRFSGWIWSANTGWISLSNAMAFVQTDEFRPGVDSDGDGLPDDWELSVAGNLTVLDGAGDPDGDGLSNAQEYLAGTDPLDPNSALRIVSWSVSQPGAWVTLSWASRPTRLYQIEQTYSLGSATNWSDAGLGVMAPDAGATTVRTFSSPANRAQFFRVRAVKPPNP